MEFTPIVKKLYKKDPSISSFNRERAKVLYLISKKFSAVGNRLLKAMPTFNELEKVFLGFPMGKLLGGDGVTYDFVQACWGFVGNCCQAMVLSFWNDAKLSSNSVNKIVKMVPKRSNLLDFLDNWHNLTMLTTSYKIISKVLAERFKPIVPKIVDKQQIGFVYGRCITGNLLSLKLGQEHVIATL